MLGDGFVFPGVNSSPPPGESTASGVSLDAELGETGFIVESDGNSGGDHHASPPRTGTVDRPGGDETGEHDGMQI